MAWKGLIEMAKAEELTVAVEKAVHNALRETAQAIWDKHGICVRNANFSWTDASTVKGYRLVVTDVEVTTLTKA